jgi:hypothetical protein
MNRFGTTTKLLASIAAIAVWTGQAAAQGTQVGYPPATSPYVDLPFAQEFTFIGGQYFAQSDVARVGPQSGMITGVHYEWRAGGPAHITGEVAYISSDRRLINPLRSEPGRELGQAPRPLYTADVGLGMSLTGEKSWHRLVPEIGVGVGLISDLRAQPDSGGFLFGTRFAFNASAGLRYLVGGKWQIRADIKDRLYTISYPQTFFTAPTGGTAVVTSDQAKSYWLNNPALTLGLSYLF